MLFQLVNKVRTESIQVLWEITAGQLGQAPAAVTDSLPVPESAGATADDEEDLEEMQSRLQALKS